MNRTMGIGTLFTLATLTLGGCIGPPVGPGDEVGTVESALDDTRDGACLQDALQQYIECRELDCTPDAIEARNELATLPAGQLPGLVIHGYDQLCDRDCRVEAEMIYAECQEGAYHDLAAPLPTQVTLRQWHEPDYRITENAGPTDEPCIRCGHPVEE